MFQKNIYEENELFKIFCIIVKSWNCFYTMQICRALSRQILRSFVLFCCSCFFGRENLNYVTIRDNTSVLASHRKSEFIPDHELRNLDKGWRLILYVFRFSSLVKGDTLSSVGKTVISDISSSLLLASLLFLISTHLLPIFPPRSRSRDALQVNWFQFHFSLTLY